MSCDAENMSSIVNGTIALKCSGQEVAAMKAVGKAHSDRSLDGFEATLKENRAQLADAPNVHAHLNSL